MQDVFSGLLGIREKSGKFKFPSGKFTFPSGKCQGILFLSEHGNPDFLDRINPTWSNKQNFSMTTDAHVIKLENIDKLFQKMEFIITVYRRQL